MTETGPIATEGQGNEALCLATLRETDRDRYLACLLTPVERRPAISALYAFNAELARVRDLVREPLPGEVRLQYWRDLLNGAAHGATAANPVAAELLRAIDTYSLPREPLLAMVDARVFDLYDDPMETLAMFEGYAGETASALIQLASLVLNPQMAEENSESAGHAGVAQAIAGSLLLLPQHRSRGQVYLPLDLLNATGLDRQSFLEADASGLQGAIEAFAGSGLDHLRKARRSAKRAKALVPAYLPVSLVEPILQTAVTDPLRLLREDVRMAQWRRQLRMMMALWRQRF